jgi:hypothetical protein
MKFRRLRELWNKCGLTDRIIAVFTVVLASASIYQFIIMNGQLDVMRKDERAWISVVPKGPSVVHDVGIVPDTMITIQQTGKTPASNVTGHFFIEVVKNGESPDFESKTPHMRMSANIMLPNSTRDITVRRIRQVSGGGPDDGEDDPLRQSERDALETRKAWMAVYGIVWYNDVFHKTHWIKFCFWSSLPDTLTSAGQCTQNNTTDD